MKEMNEMTARLQNPAMILDAIQPAQDMYKAIHSSGVPKSTLDLVHLRASQINGCSFCVDPGARSARKSGETEERLFAVAAWRAPYFSDAERAALELAEAATRLSDRSNPVPDEVWDRVAAVRREGSRGAGLDDRPDQLLQPAECD